MEKKYKKILFFILSICLFVIFFKIQHNKNIMSNEVVLQDKLNLIYLNKKKVKKVKIYKNIKNIDIFKGQWVFITFVATWCYSYNDILSKLNKFAQKYEKEVLTIVVNVDKDWKTVKPYVKNKNPYYITTLDKKKTLSSLYQIKKYPESIIITPNGYNYVKFVGERDWSSKLIEIYFNRLINVS